MRRVLLLVSAIATVVQSAPLYGEDGGYKGYASYKPLKDQSRRALIRPNLLNDDSIDASAGSHEIVRQPSKSYVDSSVYEDRSTPDNIYSPPPHSAEDTSQHSSGPHSKKYDSLSYSPGIHHGYSGNRISDDSPEAPYHRVTLYGQSDGGYKIADAYQNQHIDSYEDREHDYNDDHLSDPQPYEYGYVLRDDFGNAQHKHESSDGNGNVKGTYGFKDEHGLYRSVQYVANKDGFRALVKTNEPGTDSSDPADVHLEVERRADRHAEKQQYEK